MVAATDANSVDRFGFGPAAPCSRSPALLKPRAVPAVEFVPSLAGAQPSVGRRASVEHGLLRSSASPGKVFGSAPAGCGRFLFSPFLALAITVGEVAPLRQREHSGQQLRWAPFG
jgi:hypothetical protein